MIKKTEIRKGKNLRKLAAAIVAMMLVVALAIGLVPANTYAATYVDANTAEGYELSLGNNISTEYAGRIWSDKSVYSGNAEFEMFGGRHGEVEKAADEDFLVAFSALATSQAISGQTQAPVDVVFVIDTSGSMQDEMSRTDDTKRIVNTVAALNDSIEAVMSLNPYTRVSVVAFSNTAEVLLELGRYEKGTRTNGRGNNQTTVEDYFSLSNDNETLYKHVISEGSSSQSDSNRSVTGGTNIQMGLYTGMNVLASREESDVTTKINEATVNRVPAIILLSDGAPTYSSNSENWWAPENNNNDGPGSNPTNAYYIGNAMKALMTGAYMKDAVDRKYNVEAKLYTVGMGISGLNGYERNLAYMTLDPENTWSQDNSVVNDIISKWNTYKNGSDVTVNVGDANWYDYEDKDYTFKHPSANDISSNENALKLLVDDYYDADNASEVTDVFEEIVSNISISTAQVPTELKGSNPINDGYITYTDPIGKYMTVDDVKAIVYAGEVYSQENGNVTKTVTPNGSVTTYTFTKEIDSNIYGKQNLKDIIIQVSKDADGNETLTVKVPASVIPVRINTVELYSDDSVKSHTNNGAYPVRVVYSVSVRDDIKTTVNEQTIIDVSKLSQEYIDANTNSDGTINFYSNLYTGENNITVLDEGKEVVRSAGNATVEFEPSHSNPFYYMQENIPIYTNATCTTQASSNTPLVDTQTYYYSAIYYNGTKVETEITPRTGAQLKKTDIIEVDGYWYRAAGSPRLNRILEFEGTKANNVTDTALEFYAPTFQYATGSTDPYAGKYVIYLGNNGLLQMKASGVLEISKEVEIPAGLTPTTTEFEFTVNFNGDATLAGAFPYDVVDAEGKVLRSGTITDKGKINLSDGQKAIIRNLAPGVTYEVTETAVDGYSTEVTGNTGAIAAGETVTAAFVNSYAVQSTIVSGILEGTKVLAGREWKNTDAFTFLISAVNDAPLPNGYNSAAGVTVEFNDASETEKEDVWEAAFDFGNITFTKPGLYRYTIMEKEPENDAYLPGMTYSRALYSVAVNVVDDGDGTLSYTTNVQKLYADDATQLFTYDETTGQIELNDETQDAIVFTNTFSMNSVTSTPVAIKRYTDNSGQNPLKAGMFSFELKALGVVEEQADGTKVLNESKVDDVPMPIVEGKRVTSIVTTNEGENITFPSVTFTYNDIPTGQNSIIFRYQMTEVDKNVNGMTYDNNVYKIDVMVSLEGSGTGTTLKVNAVYPDNPLYEGTERTVIFTNTYTPTPTTAVLSGSKTLTGRDMKSGEAFEFALTAANDAAGGLTLPPNATVSGGTDGVAKSFSFDAIKFTKPGTYQFEMKEVVLSGYEAGTRILGVEYDTHSCIVTVEVTDNNGVLVAGTPVYTGGAQFNNTYETTFEGKDPIQLNGKKVLSGRNIVNGEFTFTVNPQKVGNTDELAPMGDSFTTTSVNASGDIVLLKNVSFDKAGTYEYIIKEVLPENASTAHGVTYDTSIYKYTVVVEDVNQIGVLTVTSETLQKSTDNGSTWTPVTVKSKDGGTTFVEISNIASNEVNDYGYVPVFSNTYSTTPAERNVPVMTKILDGERAKALEAGEFQFTMSVTATELNGTTAIAAANLGEYVSLTSDSDGPTDGVWGPIGNKADTNSTDGVNSGNIEFGKIKFHKEGIFTLTFAEVEPTTGKVSGVTYTDETLVAIFKVTDNGKGALVAELLDLHGNYSFTNRYETVTPSQLKFEIHKKFTGRTDNEWLDGDKFQFEVVIRDPDTQAALSAGAIVFPTDSSEGIQKVTIGKGSDLVNAADLTVRKATAESITIKKPGVYKFRIHEVAGTIKGVNYDSTPHDVVITATDNTQGGLNLNATVDGTSVDINQNIVIRFENVYDAKSTELSGHDYLVIRKSFTGRAKNEWLSEDSFEFELTAVSAKDKNGATLDIADTTVLELTSTTLEVDNSNKAYPHFGNIKFHTAGTYVFEVKEVIPQEVDSNNRLNGITYDPTVYTITVVVGDNYTNATLVVESVTYTNKFTNQNVQALAFNNTYATESVTLEGETYLKVKKVLTGRNWNDNDTFEFTLEAYDDATKDAVTSANPTVIMNGTSVTLTKAEQEKAFGDIEFKAAGTYKFLIKETKGNFTNMTYDTHSVIVTVIVADDNEGGLVVTDGTNLVAAAPSYSGSMTFENVYTPSAVYATFGGKKVLDGRTLKAGEFRFHIEPLTTGAPVPAQRTVANDAEGNFAFGQAIYTAAGVYEYQISEMKGNLAGVVYDENPVKVVVTVTYDANTGILTPVVTYVKAGQAVDKVEFVNTYTTSSTDPVILSAVKDVTPSEGNTFIMNGGEFRFELEPAVGNPDSDPIKRAIVTNSKEGNVLFANAQFTEPGVYVYTIHEVDGNKGGINYDDSVFTITVTVEDDESIAKLKATVKIVKTKGEANPENVRVIHFNNGYNPEATTAIIHGHKYLTGGHKDLEANEFAFELKAVDYIENDVIKTKAEDTPMPVDAVNGIATVKNEETGLFQFGLITYAQEGTYAYEIREVSGGKKGYTYDSTVRRVTVSVSSVDENNVSTGELKATVVGVIDDQNNPLVTFTNTYVPGTTSATIGGTKKLTGRNMTVDADGKGEFEFALLDSTGQEIRKATNASAGEKSAFTFESITYDKAGTYTYTIVEKNTNLSGVTYDLTTSYVAKVTVTDRDANGMATGQLNATVKYYANNAEVKPEEVVFNNTYKAASTTATLGAAKVLSGRTLKENEFTFKLEALTEGAPMPEAGKEVAKNNEQGAINFGEITFENAGTYEYQISEVKGEDAYVKYDTAAYKVTVKVTDNLKGQLTAKVSGIEEAVFENAYKADPVEVIFGGKKELVKVLNGRELKAKEFTFILKDSEGNIIGEALNSADGTFAFKGIIFDKAGSYNFVIEEKDTKVNGITYDKGICYVHVEVVDNYKGNLIPTVTYGKDAKMGDSVAFTNSYKAASTSTQISAVKKLSGRDLIAGEFRFVLEDEQGNKIYATNAADGTILFDKITYTEAGTYVYKIYEEKGTAANVTYDDKVYTVTVVVEDDMNGSLSVTSQFDASRFVFKNTYKNPEVVYTGDATVMIPMLTMFVLSAGYILVSLMRARKK